MEVKTGNFELIRFVVWFLGLPDSDVHPSGGAVTNNKSDCQSKNKRQAKRQNFKLSSFIKHNNTSKKLCVKKHYSRPAA